MEKLTYNKYVIYIIFCLLIMKEFIYNDVVFTVGQSAQENWDLINFESDHIWLHLNSFPSCHVVIDSDNPTEAMIRYGADLCKSNTKYKNLKNLTICYTRCSNLKKGSDVGSVVYKSNRKVKTVTI